MKVQIIGGTRFIGPYVVKQLLQMGHEVCVFHRGENPLTINGVLEIKGDRDQLEDFADAFKQFGPDVVLDMFPYIESDAKKVVEVFKGIAGKIVALSSLDIYRAYERLLNLVPGPVEPTPLKEDSPLREGLYPLQFLYSEGHRLHFYDKKLVEDIYMNAEDFSCSIIRLPQVYGPGDRQHRMFPYLKRMLDGRKFILLGDQFASWKVSRGYVEDIAYGIALVVTNQSAQNKIFNLAEQRPYTEIEWVERIAQKFGWEGEIVVVPEIELSKGMNALQHWMMDTSRIRDEHGYKELIDTEIAISNTIAWEKNHFPAEVSMDDFDYEKEDLLLEKYLRC